MTDLQLRLEAFVKLGTMFQEFCEYSNNEEGKRQSSNLMLTSFSEAIALASHQNGWFTKDNILYSLQNWANLLKEERLKNWLGRYSINGHHPKTVALIMAGNIPLVGFHDFLATVIFGNKALIKLSSNDKTLLPFIAKYLLQMEPLFQDKIVFVDGLLTEFDAVIATGSDNTSRYFEYYFGKNPNIIRKNRNSVAVLTGKESETQLTALGEDIFRYYGLGCRSVSKLFVPRNYDFDAFFKSLHSFSSIINQVKYANNYDYNKAVYLMSEFKFLDNGFLMLKEDESYASPIATVFFEYYDSLEELRTKIKNKKHKIQCVVAQSLFDDEIPFGQTQQPGLSDYADGIDTVKFLLKTI